MRKRELEDLKQRLDSLKYDIIKSIQDSNSNIGILNAFSSSEEADIGSARQVVQIDENMLAKNNKDLLEINKALEKMANNKYGKCEMCNMQIDIKRLKVKPHARFCISCREIYEKQQYKKVKI